MRFDLTVDQRLVRDVTRAFLAAEHPLAQVRAGLEEANGFDADLWKQVADLGWTSPLAPAGIGGGSITDEPVVDLTVIAAEVGRAVAPGPFLETSVVIDTIARYADPHLQDRYLPGLLEGSMVAAWCVDHSAWLRERPGCVLATRTSGGGARLDGEVAAAVTAGVDVLMVSTPALTCLVPAAADGLVLRRLQWLDPSTRHAVVGFDGVVVPPEQVVGDHDDELERQSRLAWVLQAAELAGIVDAVLAFTLEWLSERYSFGRPLASYQALKHRCADMKMSLEATHAIADDAARAVAADAPDAGLLARAAKAYAATSAVELIQDCTQLHGGIGVTWEHDLHLYLRRATLLWRSYGTPSELYTAIGAAELEEVRA